VKKARDRRPQAIELLAEHVVRSACLHRCDGKGLAAFTGKHDDGRVAAECRATSQGVRSPKPTGPVASQNDIGQWLESADERRFGRHAASVRVEPNAPQLIEASFRIAGVETYDEDVNWCRHVRPRVTDSRL
jgi:hypothetical protein